MPLRKLLYFLYYGSYLHIHFLYSLGEPKGYAYPDHLPHTNLNPPTMYMWQSRIEIEYYSVAYFERITDFDAL